MGVYIPNMVAKDFYEMCKKHNLEIIAAPAADVRSAVRGHWISEEEAEEKGDYSLRDACSVCGHCDWDCTESASFNYCPNCGADMRPEPPKEEAT